MDQTIADYTVARLRSADIASEANRYSGRNVAGYNNARFDELLGRLHVTIDPQEQTRINVDLVREAFTDLADFLEAVDVVTIASPGTAHAAQALAAIGAGKPVYVEKPLTITIP